MDEKMELELEKLAIEAATIAFAKKVLKGGSLNELVEKLRADAQLIVDGGSPVEGDSCDCLGCWLRRGHKGPDPGMDEKKAQEISDLKEIKSKLSSMTGGEWEREVEWLRELEF